MNGRMIEGWMDWKEEEAEWGRGRRKRDWCFLREGGGAREAANRATEVKQGKVNEEEVREVDERKVMKARSEVFVQSRWGEEWTSDKDGRRRRRRRRVILDKLITTDPPFPALSLPPSISIHLSCRSSPHSLRLSRNKSVMFASRRLFKVKSETCTSNRKAFN